MSRLLVPRCGSRGPHASRSARAHVPPADRYGRPYRSQSGRPERNAAVAAAARCRRTLLRQNAAAMLVERRLEAVRNESLAAISYVNLYFHWDFPKFNI